MRYFETVLTFIPFSKISTITFSRIIEEKFEFTIIDLFNLKLTLMELF